MGDHQEDELLDYEEEEAEHEQAGNGAEAAGDKRRSKAATYPFTHLAFEIFSLSPSCSELL
jgi:hypothetical protein